MCLILSLLVELERAKRQMVQLDRSRHVNNPRSVDGSKPWKEASRLGQIKRHFV
jgi:hypothetical protein